MNLNQSYNQHQISPNFGMALKIKPNANKFLEGLSREERQYVRDLGHRIEGSQNHITIKEGGEVYNVWEPKASDIRITKDDTEKAELERIRKAEIKRYNSTITKDEKIELLKEGAKTIGNIIKIKLNPQKSKFMKDLQIAEQKQRYYEKYDAISDGVKARLEKSDYEAKIDTERLMSQFGEKVE